MRFIAACAGAAVARVPTPSPAVLGCPCRVARWASWPRPRTTS